MCWMKDDLSVLIKMAFAVIVGMADPEKPGSVAVGLDLFDIHRMTGGHAALEVDIQNHD